MIHDTGFILCTLSCIVFLTASIFSFVSICVNSWLNYYQTSSSKLFSGLLNCCAFSFGLGVPATRSARFNRQRITAQAYRQGKWSENYEVENSQDNPRLKVADLPRNSLPPFPKVLHRDWPL